jgi:hypothetical protein
MWLLFLQSRDLATPPSTILGLTPGSYEAFCFDQAVWYFGSQVISRVEKAGHKPIKGEAQTRAAQERELKKILDGDAAKRVYADPAALFG